LKPFATNEIYKELVVSIFYSWTSKFEQFKYPKQWKISVLKSTIIIDSELFHFRDLIICKATKIYKGVGGCQLIYEIESHKTLQDRW
jgi:hypothetical protein